MSRKNKFLYLHIIQADYGYGHGWEDVAQSESFKEARADFREYRMAEPQARHRMIRRRELA